MPGYTVLTISLLPCDRAFDQSTKSEYGQEIPQSHTTDQPTAFQVFLNQYAEKNSAEICMYISGAGSVQISQQLCTSGYKYDTFNICSSNLPG